MSGNLRFGLAGLQTGVTGALAMLLWFFLASVFTRRGPWWMPNLIASVHYGQASVRYGPGIYTLAGIALLLFFYGAIGMVFGFLLQDTAGGFRFFCFSVVLALGLYWALARWFWHATNPVGNLYAPTGQIFFAHLLYAFCLARYPGAARRMTLGE